MPSVLDPSQHLLWEQSGSRGTRQRDQVKLRKILAKHRPPALIESAQAEIENILAEEAGRAGEAK
jgi:trimethylamine:corrinoid methyltransferase-like protein